jgi:hypothetical protein
MKTTKTKPKADEIEPGMWVLNLCDGYFYKSKITGIGKNEKGGFYYCDDYYLMKEDCTVLKLNPKIESNNNFDYSEVVAIVPQNYKMKDIPKDFPEYFV